MKLIKVFKVIRRLIIERSSMHLRIEYLRKQGVQIGERCIIETMDFSTEPYLVEIGDDVAIAGGTVFITHDAGINCFRDEFPDDDVFGKIKIGNKVFIGSNCTLLPNTTIGNNSIIGAGSTLRGTYPSDVVIAGNPAKVITNINVQRLLYRQNPGRLATYKMTDQEKKPYVIEHFKKLN